jgi:hypothetical protein
MAKALAKQLIFCRPGILETIIKINNMAYNEKLADRIRKAL